MVDNRKINVNFNDKVRLATSVRNSWDFADVIKSVFKSIKLLTAIDYNI